MQENGKFVLIISTILLFIIIVSLIILFTTFQKKKNTLIEERKRNQEAFEKAITETQIEIREETLRNISWELHDNIGQLLTLAKIQLQTANNPNNHQVLETLSKGLNEVRALSKLINPDVIQKINLKDAIQLEIDRFNRLQFINASLQIEGVFFKIDEKASIILFRILQEFFSNTIKHSRAKNLIVTLKYQENLLDIYAHDDGVGFDITSEKTGIGLINMQNRAKLIGASLNLSSNQTKGTHLQINYDNGKI